MKRMESEKRKMKSRALSQRKKMTETQMMMPMEMTRMKVWGLIKKERPTAWTCLACWERTSVSEGGARFQCSICHLSQSHSLFLLSAYLELALSRHVLFLSQATMLSKTFAELTQSSWSLFCGHGWVCVPILSIPVLSFSFISCL